MSTGRTQKLGAFIYLSIGHRRTAPSQSCSGGLLLAPRNALDIESKLQPFMHNTMNVISETTRSLLRPLPPLLSSTGGTFLHWVGALPRTATSSANGRAAMKSASLHPSSRAVLLRLQQRFPDFIESRGLQSRGLGIKPDGTFELHFPKYGARLWTSHDNARDQHWLKVYTFDAFSRYALPNVGLTFAERVAQRRSPVLRVGKGRPPYDPGVKFHISRLSHPERKLRKRSIPLRRQQARGQDGLPSATGALPLRLSQMSFYERRMRKRSIHVAAAAEYYEEKECFEDNANLQSEDLGIASPAKDERCERGRELAKKVDEMVARLIRWGK